MATIKKIRKYQNAPKPIKKSSSSVGYSPTAIAVDSLRAAASGQLGTPEGEKTLKRLKKAEAKERMENAQIDKKKPKGKTGIKVTKAKNISAGPSKKSRIAPKVDPKGQYTKVQQRTLGNMKKGGKTSKKK